MVPKNTQQSKAQSKTIVIGIGNEYRSDDGAGIIAANRLRERISNDTMILVKDGEPNELMDCWMHADKVILIDAMSSNESPGTLTRFNVGEKPLPSKLFHYSTHSFNIAEVIELARVLNKLPKELIVFGVEGRDFGNGDRISPEVDRAIEKIVECIKEELELN